jgi:proline racemase
MELNWEKYTPGENTMIITTLDTHTAGEPLRIITGGMPELPGATILARRRYMQEHYDHIRRALMWEPRGHYNMWAAVRRPMASPRPPKRLRRLCSDAPSRHPWGTP